MQELDPTQKCKGDSLPKKCKRKGNYNELDIDTNQLLTFRNDSESFYQESEKLNSLKLKLVITKS